jgi:hypothetical protein
VMQKEWRWAGGEGRGVKYYPSASTHPPIHLSPLPCRVLRCKKGSALTAVVLQATAPATQPPAQPPSHPAIQPPSHPASHPLTHSVRSFNPPTLPLSLPVAKKDPLWQQ